MSDNKERYAAAMHKVQTGIGFIGGKALEPKHLRVGINSAHITHDALATLLIERGVFTLEEYEAAVADAAEREAAHYQAAVQEILPGTVLI